MLFLKTHNSIKKKENAGQIMKIMIAGASGLIGTELVPFLKSKGHTVQKLVRKNPPFAQDETYWNPSLKQLDSKDLEGVDAVINLAGENIADGRWSEAKKNKILESRVSSARLISQTLASMDNPPKILVNASATGFYGDRGDEELNETSASGTNSFIAKVCRDWESATLPAAQKGIRVVLLRIGVVLSAKGGALAKMITPFKIGLGGVIGSGNQYISWIAIDDLIEAIEYVLTHNDVSGPVNTVAPNSVSNKEFTKTLGEVLNRPTLLPLPAFAARLAFGEMADELLLASSKVIPRTLKTSGFNFNFPSLESALKHILGYRS